MVLLLRLITPFNADEESPFDEDSFDECYQLNKEKLQCTSINSSLKSKRNKYCRITINYDPSGLTNKFS